MIDIITIIEQTMLELEANYLSEHAFNPDQMIEFAIAKGVEKSDREQLFESVTDLYADLEKKGFDRIDNETLLQRTRRIHDELDKFRDKTLNLLRENQSAEIGETHIAYFKEREIRLLEAIQQIKIKVNITGLAYASKGSDQEKKASYISRIEAETIGGTANFVVRLFDAYQKESDFKYRRLNETYSLRILGWLARELDAIDSYFEHSVTNLLAQFYTSFDNLEIWADEFYDRSGFFTVQSIEMLQQLGPEALKIIIRELPRIRYVEEIEPLFPTTFTSIGDVHTTKKVPQAHHVGKVYSNSKEALAQNAILMNMMKDLTFSVAYFSPESDQLPHIHTEEYPAVPLSDRFKEAMMNLDNFTRLERSDAITWLFSTSISYANENFEALNRIYPAGNRDENPRNILFGNLGNEPWQDLSRLVSGIDETDRFAVNSAAKNISAFMFGLDYERISERTNLPVELVHMLEHDDMELSEDEKIKWRYIGLLQYHMMQNIIHWLNAGDYLENVVSIVQAKIEPNMKIVNALSILSNRISMETDFIGNREKYRDMIVNVLSRLPLKNIVTYERNPEFVFASAKDAENYLKKFEQDVELASGLRNMISAGFISRDIGPQVERANRESLIQVEKAASDIALELDMMLSHQYESIRLQMLQAEYLPSRNLIKRYVTKARTSFENYVQLVIENVMGEASNLEIGINRELIDKFYLNEISCIDSNLRTLVKRINLIVERKFSLPENLAVGISLAYALRFMFERSKNYDLKEFASAIAGIESLIPKVSKRAFTSELRNLMRAISLYQYSYNLEIKPIDTEMLLIDRLSEFKPATFFSAPEGLSKKINYFDISKLSYEQSLRELIEVQGKKIFVIDHCYGRDRSLKRKLTYFGLPLGYETKQDGFDSLDRLEQDIQFARKKVGDENISVVVNIDALIAYSKQNESRLRIQDRDRLARIISLVRNMTKEGDMINLHIASSYTNKDVLAFIGTSLTLTNDPLEENVIVNSGFTLVPKLTNYVDGLAENESTFKQYFIRRAGDDNHVVRYSPVTKDISYLFLHKDEILFEMAPEKEHLSELDEIRDFMETSSFISALRHNKSYKFIKYIGSNMLFKGQNNVLVSINPFDNGLRLLKATPHINKNYNPDIDPTDNAYFKIAYNNFDGSRHLDYISKVSALEKKITDESKGDFIIPNDYSSGLRSRTYHYVYHTQDGSEVTVNFTFALGRMDYYVHIELFKRGPEVSENEKRIYENGMKTYKQLNHAADIFLDLVNERPEDPFSRHGIKTKHQKVKEKK